MTKKDEQLSLFVFSAEREGFEPPVPLSTAVFKTAVIDHSTTFPVPVTRCRSQKRCKGRYFFLSVQTFRCFF